MTKNNYAGIEDKFAGFDSSKVLLQSIPYDGTSTWGKGADKGFEAFCNASENMELYDIETNSEVYKQGIHILPELNANSEIKLSKPKLNSKKECGLKEFSSPENMFNSVFYSTKKLLKTNKFLTFFGGEHSISIGIIKAFAERHKNMSVLQLDAHADLRKSYLGSQYNHACALHWASQNLNLVQVGIRSMDFCEKQYMNYEKCFFAHQIHNSEDWMQKSIDLLTENVYLTIDLDVFDPSILPATGTPEPGGLKWYETLKFLKKLMQQKNVIGFDIVELAPIKNHKASEFLVAKLYYKLLNYKFSI